VITQVLVLNLVSYQLALQAIAELAAEYGAQPARPGA
jgi:hypothetical protein